MAEFFQTAHLKEEFFPLINPRVAAVHVHKQVVYTCNIHSWDWRAPGSAAELRGAARRWPGARVRDLLPLWLERGSPNPSTQGSLASGTAMTGLGKKAPPREILAKPERSRRRRPPQEGAWSYFLSPKNNRKTLLKVHFYCVPKPNRKQREKKK